MPKAPNASDHSLSIGLKSHSTFLISVILILCTSQWSWTSKWAMATADLDTSFFSVYSNLLSDASSMEHKISHFSLRLIATNFNSQAIYIQIHGPCPWELKHSRVQNRTSVCEKIPSSRRRDWISWKSINSMQMSEYDFDKSDGGVDSENKI